MKIYISNFISKYDSTQQILRHLIALILLKSD